MNRRGFLGGLLAAPAIIRTPGLLMPVRPLEAFEFSGFYTRIPVGQLTISAELARITRRAVLPLLEAQAFAEHPLLTLLARGDQMQ